MELIKLSDYIVDTIARRTGVRHVFMVTGGMAMHLIESFGRHPNMTVVPTHHEQAAGVAASSYGRVRGTPGVVLVTAGPGALNAVNPCAGAFMESVPLVIVSGQVSRANSRQGHHVRQRGIQEAEIVDVVRSLTKYAAKIDDPERVRMHVERGLRLAVTGRPGPVWFDVPVDVQAAMIDPDSLPGDEEGKVAEPLSDSGDVFARMTDALRTASRPLLVLGHGIRLAGAARFAERLVDRLGIPFQTTWNGMDLVGNSHQLFFGRANVFGPRYANLIIQNADLVLAIGARFGIQHTGYNVGAFCRGARLIMVDIDETEMGKPGLSVSDKIVMDAGKFMEGMLSAERSVVPSRVADWISYCERVKKKFPIAPKIEDLNSAQFVEPKYFVDRLSEAMPDNAVFPFGSSGMGHTETGGIFRCKNGQRVYTFKGLAAMGYGLPCAVGAAIAAGDRPVFTLIGEGGLHLNVHELQTIRQFALRVKIIVLNNGGYHSIHMTQKAYFDGHFVGSGPESSVSFPSIKGLTALYGLNYYKIVSNHEIDRTLGDFVGDSKAAILEVVVDPMKPLEPKIASSRLTDGSMVSRPLEDMTPLLDRNELRDLMFIPILDM